MTNDRTQPGSNPPPQELTTRFLTSVGRSILTREFGDGIVSKPELLSYDPQDLSGRVAFITGGSSGLGRATAMLFAESGALVAVTGQDRARTHATRDAIIGMGGQALAIVGDMRDPGTAHRAVAETVDRFGRVDMGVLNAGIIDDANIIDMTPEQWYNVAHGNSDMTFFPAQALARQMIGQDESHPMNITYVSSISAFGNEGQPNYSSAKAGSEVLMKALARTKAMKNVSVGIFRPGLIDTEMIQRMSEQDQKIMSTMSRAIMPMKRMLTPQEGARGIAYLSTRKESGHVLTLT